MTDMVIVGRAHIVFGGERSLRDPIGA
jgi:hypothetical protein